MAVVVALLFCSAVLLYLLNTDGRGGFAQPGAGGIHRHRHRRQQGDSGLRPGGAARDVRLSRVFALGVQLELLPPVSVA